MDKPIQVKFPDVKFPEISSSEDLDRLAASVRSTFRMNTSEPNEVTKAAMMEAREMHSLADKVASLGLTVEELEHPMFVVVLGALRQAMYGKGKRHGGNAVPWLKQPIFHYCNMHGRGFLTGQAAKKLEEAASTRSGDPFITEVEGAIVYAAASIVAERLNPAAQEKANGG